MLTVAEGDLLLTTLGKTYAEASILARKELIAGRVLRIPVVNRVYEALQQDDNHRIDRTYFLGLFRDEYGEHAEAELETVIAWGRYAELFSFDQATGELYLES
jgi:NitT/TauT family transport system ATP-binding protein